MCLSAYGTYVLLEEISIRERLKVSLIIRGGRIWILIIRFIIYNFRLKSTPWGSRYERTQHLIIKF